MRYRRCARNCEPGAPNQHVTGQALHWVAPGRRFEGVDRQARRPAVASFVRGRVQPSGTGKFFSEVTTARPVSGVAAHFEQRRAICRVDHAGTGASAWAGFGYCNENRILFVRRGIGRGSVFDRRVRARRRSSRRRGSDLRNDRGHGQPHRTCDQPSRRVGNAGRGRGDREPPAERSARHLAHGPRRHLQPQWRDRNQHRCFYPRCGERPDRRADRRRQAQRPLFDRGRLQLRSCPDRQHRAGRSGAWFAERSLRQPSNRRRGEPDHPRTDRGPWCVRTRRIR